MKKFAIFGMVAVLVLCAGVLMAKAVKFNLVAAPIANPTEPGASGQAILNYAAGANATEIQVNCWGLKPDAKYVIKGGWIGGTMLIGEFTTKKNGTGNFHIRLPEDLSSLPYIIVFNEADARVLING